MRSTSATWRLQPCWGCSLAESRRYCRRDGVDLGCRASVFGAGWWGTWANAQIACGPRMVLERFGHPVGTIWAHALMWAIWSLQADGSRASASGPPTYERWPMRPTVRSRVMRRKCWNFRKLARPRGFEPLTFGIGMQNNWAYIARALVWLVGAMRRYTQICLIDQHVRFAPFVTFYPDRGRSYLAPCSTL